MTPLTRLETAKSVSDGLMLLYSCNVQPRDEYFGMIGAMHRELLPLVEGMSQELESKIGRKKFKGLLREIRQMGRGMHWVPYFLVLRKKAPRCVVRERGMHLLERIDAALSEVAPV